MNNKSWWGKLKEGLKKSSSSLTGSLKLLVGKKVDQRFLDEVEDLLIMHDFGVHTAHYLREKIEEDMKRIVDPTMEDVKRAIVEEITSVLLQNNQAWEIGDSLETQVILFVGVNGSGKTTSMAKLTKQLLNLGYTVEWAACDTFRSAAVEQLQVWAKRVGVHVYTTKPNGDAAGLAFEALSNASQKGIKVLIIDTAGRLQNKDNLMQELLKIKRVLKKVHPQAPHHTWLVLDATTGQNAYNQVEVFHHTLELSGLVMNKLDGTAKGGVLVGLSKKYNIPIMAIGVGEKIEDFLWFNPKAFAESLLTTDNEEKY